MIFYSKPNATEPRLHWYIDGCMVPIFNEGDLIKCVGLSWEWAHNQDGHIEIACIEYGSIDGIIMPEIEDIHQAIQEQMGLRNTLIFPDTLTHNSKL